MKRYLLITTFLLLLYSKGNTQTSQNTNLPNVLPVAPTAFEFLKYSDIPVSKYTGVPNISIPIYTIKARGLDIPIFLSYHANGFRVNEESGWTGLGWTLNPQASIVQLMKGFDDFGPRKNRKKLDPDAIADVEGNGAPNGAFTTCNGSSSMGLSSVKFPVLNPPRPSDSTGEPTDQVLPLSFIIGDKDYEPDVFQFNLLGYSGKFILDWETDTFVCLTDSKIKVEKTRGSYDEITIRTPEGHYGVFAIKEESSKEIWNAIGAGSNNGSPYLDGEVLSRIYKLEHIYTNQNDHIAFTYEITTPIMSALELNSKYITFEDTGTAPLSVGFYNISGYGMGGTGLSSGEIRTFSKTKQSMSFLNKITFNKGVVMFSTSNRTDIIGAKKLDKIEIKESEIATDVIKTIDFNYSYFVGHTNGTTSENHRSYLRDWDTKTETEKTHRLKLDSITESGKPPYVFEYNTTPLPKKNSWATDYWGYYNGKLNNSTMHVNLYRFNYQLNAPTNTFDSSNTNNKSANETYTKSAILEKITYPTGGYSVFNYELNNFTNYSIPNYTYTNNTPLPTGHISRGGGLRIKKISAFNHNDVPISQKLYTYQGGKIMTPLQFFNKAYISSFYYVRGYSGVSGAIWGRGSGYRRTQSANSMVAPSTNASGSYVGYNSVTEHFTEHTNETITIGTIETDYENHVDEGFYDITNPGDWRAQGQFIELGRPTMEANKTRNGSILEERIKNSNGTLLQKTVNEYRHGIRYSSCATGVSFGPVLSSSYGYSNPNRKHLLGFYPIRGLDSYLIKQEITKYDGVTPITTKSEYTYNSYLQLKETKTINSDDTVLYQYQNYSIDNLNVGLGHLSNLIEVKTIKNGHIINWEEYSYNSTTLGVYPINALSTISNNKIEIVDFLQYNTKGNLEKVYSSNKPLITKYIWDYYGKYPLVKMEGSDTHNWPSTYYVNAVITASKDYSNTTAIISAVNDLRAHSNVYITNYTYKNLVGVSSITNPHNETTYYLYDDNNRLQYVKDNDGNILNETQYHYKGE